MTDQSDQRNPVPNRISCRFDRVENSNVSKASELPTWLFVLHSSLDPPCGVNEVVKDRFLGAMSHLSHRPVLLVSEPDQKNVARRMEGGRLTVHASGRDPWSLWLPL